MVKISRVPDANMEVTFTIIVIVLIGLLTQWYMKNRRYIKLMSRFPNPPTVFIFGNTLDLKSPTDLIPNFSEYTKLYGDKVKLYIGISASKLLISDLRLVEHILSSTEILNKGSEYQIFSNWLGKGLLISDGDNVWKKHRKLITPSFHFQIFKEFIDVFESNTQVLVRKLKKEVGNPSFDIYPYITLCSLDIICETAMGTSICAQENKHSDYVKSVKLMCKLFIKRTFNPLLSNDFFYKFSSLYKKEKSAVQVLHNYTEDIVAKRKKISKSNVKDVIDETGRKSKMVLLDLLLQQNELSEAFTDVELREEVDTFLFAGHDTTSSALAFTLFCLAENPTVQNKVIEELNDIFGDDKLRSVNFNDVQSMKYLEAVIKESLRLYPSVPYYSRTVKTEFEFDGYIIPKGVSLIINTYAIHHDPKFFPEPEVFNPDRFFGEKTQERPNFSYLPFSFGPRNCIGQKFAMLEMKTALSVLLRHFEFSAAVPNHKLILAAQTVLSSNNGIRVCISERKL